MESHPSASDRSARIPPIVWFLGLGLITALVAIFVFNVAPNTVAYYGFFALMFGSHFFMHGGHAGHQPSVTSNTDQANKDDHAGHSGGCH